MMSGSATATGGGSDTVPYQAKVLAEFLGLVGRYFYDDGAIILLDFFAKEQRAFTEIELKERLRWRETLLHQKLYALEKQLLFERFVEAEKGAKSVHLWRIHSKVFLAVEWRLDSVFQQLKTEIRKAERNSDLQCSNPTCGVSVPLLEAASGPTSLKDDHPLCKLCGSPLTTANSEKSRLDAEDKLRRATQQFARLREMLTRVRGMQIPAFVSATLSAAAEAAAAASVPAAAETAASTVEHAPPKSSASPRKEGSSSDLGSVTRAIPWFHGESSAPAALVTPTPVNVPASSMSFGTSGRLKGAFKPVTLLPPGSLLESSAPMSGTSEISAESSASAKLSGNRDPFRVAFGATGGGGSTTGKPFSLSLTAKSDVSGCSSKSPSEIANARKRGVGSESLAAAFEKRVKL